MLDIKNIGFAISQILSFGADSFLKNYSSFESAEVEGVNHFTSLLPAFEKFILFEFKSRKISLIFSDKNITFSDICKHFTIIESNYSFRDDISKVKISESVYITVDGKLNTTTAPNLSTDPKGNIKYADEIEVKSIVVELN